MPRRPLPPRLAPPLSTLASTALVTTEPPPDDHPLVQLLELPNFILTPHVAWASQEAIQGLADQLVDNVEAFWAGSPRNVVVPA